MVIGRIGADEFSIFYPDQMKRYSLETLIERLIYNLMQPYQLPSYLHSINVSVGIVAMPKDGYEPGYALRRSNLVLQNARARGIGDCAFFQPKMGKVVDHRQWME